MQLADLKEMIAASASDYVRMLADAAIARIQPDDVRAFDVLAGLVTYKGAAAIPELIDAAAKVVPSGKVRSEHLQAAIEHIYPSEAWQILQLAMRAG